MSVVFVWVNTTQRKGYIVNTCKINYKLTPVFDYNIYFIVNFVCGTCFLQVNIVYLNRFLS